MNIAVDARELTGKRTGVGTYLAHLLDEWARMPEARAHRWTLYRAGGAEELKKPRQACHQPEGWRSHEDAGGGLPGFPPPRGCPPTRALAWPRRSSCGQQRAEAGSQGARDRDGAAGKNQLCDPFEFCDLPGTGGTLWEQRTLAAAIRRAQPDVLFAPGYTAPLAVGTPVVLTVHDVSFVAHPEWFGRREGLRRRLVTRWAARRARSVVTVSEFSKREIVLRLGVPSPRVTVVRHGIARPASLPPNDARAPMVLYVGSIFNRRHVPGLIRAFASVAADVAGARLEIVGDNRTHPYEDLAALVRELNIVESVGVRSYVSDAELASLYANAAAFAFLSEYEGFGFTPLEALAHGVPVVVLDTPVAREVYEDAALYVQPGDISGTAVALERLLLEPGTRHAQVEHAARVLARYCWSYAARRTLDVILEAGRRG